MRDSVEKHLQKNALFWGEREYTYEELWQQAAFVAEQLQRRFRVQPGDRVGLWLKNCPEFIPSFFGILQRRRGGRADQQFPQARRGELHPEATPGIDVLITDAELGARITGRSRRLDRT